MSKPKQPKLLKPAEVEINIADLFGMVDWYIKTKMAEQRAQPTPQPSSQPVPASQPVPTAQRNPDALKNVTGLQIETPHEPKTPLARARRRFKK